MIADPPAAPQTPSEPSPSAATELVGAGAAQLLVHARDGVVAADAQGLVTEWNPGAERMLGWLRPEAIGQPLSVLIVPVHTSAMEGAGLASWIAGGLDGLLELDVLHRNGRPVTLELSGFALPTPAGQTLGLFLRDVSQRQALALAIAARRRTEDEWRAALVHQQELNELRSRFVRMTSHEFRTPLATILSSVDLIRHYGDRLSVAARLEVLDGVEAAVQRMARMLDRILLIGRADAQMLAFRPVSLDVQALCRRCVDDACSEHPARADDIALDFQCPQRTGVLDEKLLHQVLGNLLSNAVTYSPAGGAVRLRVLQEGAAWVFEVSDEGIGVPVPDQRHVFEAFHRASNVGDIPGTGLGLAIVKKAVDVHGGTIEVCSAAERGSCFRVRLGMPAAQTP